MENKTIYIIGGLLAAGAAVYFFRRDRNTSGNSDIPTPDNNAVIPAGPVVPAFPITKENPVVEISPLPVIPNLLKQPNTPPPPTQDIYSPPQRQEIPPYLQSSVTPAPDYVEAYNPQPVGPAIEPIYIPQPFAPIEKQPLNPDQNLQPPVMVQPTLPAIAVKYPPGSLLRSGDSDKVYLVNTQGLIQWFKTRAAFDRRGYNMKNVKSIPSSDMSKFQRGADLSGLGGLGMAYALN